MKLAQSVKNAKLIKPRLAQLLLSKSSGFSRVLNKMSTFMHVAKTGLNSQQIKMQVIANNLANVNTTGFKADRANFESLLYQILRGAGDNTSENTSLTSGLSVGTGTRLLNTSKLHTQGSLINTGNSLDISIEGDGFFQVLLPDGRVAYTRSGAFSRNAEGTVTTASGYPIQPEITIPAEALSINIFLTALYQFSCQAQ